MALVGWIWLVYTLVDMGPRVLVHPALAPAALLLGGVLALGCNRHSATWAAVFLIFGMATTSMAASWFSFSSLAPYAFSLVASVAGLLVNPAAGLLTAVPCVLLVAIAGRYGVAGPAPMEQIVQPAVLVCLTGLLSFLSARNLHHAVRWAWENAGLARRRLEEARDRQEVLNRTLRSLDEMYALLQQAHHGEAVARERAERSERHRAQFAANVSHELRTPLNLIIGFSELMHSAPEVYGEFPWPAALRSDVNEIYRNACHLSHLIDDILDLAQMDAMRMPLREEDVDLVDLVREVVTSTAGLARARDLSLEMQVLPALNPGLERSGGAVEEASLSRVHLDPTRIRQVLLNLIANACRFTERGSVVVSLELEGNEAHVRIADTGIGMTPEQLSRVFQEFEQADGSLRRPYGGTGLGLAISKRFVELHNGRMWAESELGVGSTFHFTLPVSAAGRTSGFVHMPGSPVGGQRAQSRTVVLQGPADSGLRLLSRYIGDYRFVPSRNPEETLALVRKEHPWAVLVAAVSPSEGEALASRLAKSYPQFSVPVFSYSMGAAALSCLPANVEWLPKPMQRKALLATLARVAPEARDLLIVDDDPAAVHLLVGMMRSADRGYVPREAYSGREAMEAIAANPPDALLLDLIMPDMDGLQVVECLRCDPTLADMPVLMISASDVSVLHTEVEVPQVSALTLLKSHDLKTQEWLNCVKAFLGAVAPRYVSDLGSSEWHPAEQSD